jgi:tellurite resistance protein TehA-like permease
MAPVTRAERFRFLYREGEGAIDRRTWALASLPPAAIALLLTAIWLAIAPSGPRDLAREAFVDPIVVATHAYFLVYAFALILCAVAEYFVSAKRFADRARPPALAGLAPFSLLLAGAAHWYQPRSEGTMPEGLACAFDALAIAILAWNVVELGFGASRRR